MQSVDNIKNEPHVRLTVLCVLNDRAITSVGDTWGVDRGLIVGNLISGIFPQNFDKSREESKYINVLSLRAEI